VTAGGVAALGLLLLLAIGLAGWVWRAADAAEADDR
jgi:hypothetical protein